MTRGAWSQTRRCDEDPRRQRSARRSVASPLRPRLPERSEARRSRARVQAAAISPAFAPKTPLLAAGTGGSRSEARGHAPSRPHRAQLTARARLLVVTALLLVALSASWIAHNGPPSSAPKPAPVQSYALRSRSRRRAPRRPRDLAVRDRAMEQRRREPGAMRLGVTSLDGNICTNAGARRTRSTIVRSRIIDVYWIAPSSGVFALSTMSRSCFLHSEASPGMRLSSGDQLSAHVAVLADAPHPGLGVEEERLVAGRVARRSEEHHAVAEREIARREHDFVDVERRSCRRARTRPRWIGCRSSQSSHSVRGARSFAFGKRAACGRPRCRAGREVLRVEVIERDVVDVARRMPMRASCASSGSNSCARTLEMRLPNCSMRRAKNRRRPRPSTSVGLKRRFLSSPCLQELHEQSSDAS